jgi:hypothetical protein
MVPPTAIPAKVATTLIGEVTLYAYRAESFAIATEVWNCHGAYEAIRFGPVSHSAGHGEAFQVV